MNKYLICFIYLTFVYSTTIKINLISTNDIHGVIGEQKANFMNPHFPPTIIGGAAFAKYIDQLKEQIKYNNEGLIILDGGNFFQGSTLGMADDGLTMIEWMNRIGYDAMVLGNYDFISGANNINKLADIATFPFLFSNLKCDNCPLISSNIKNYIIKDIEGIKVGIIGIVNSKLDELVLAENLSGVEVQKEIISANSWINYLKSNGADLVIVLTSSGVPWNREEEYNKFIQKVNSNQINETNSLNALEMGYYLDEADVIVAGGNSKGYPLPWYDPNSHVYIIQGYGGGTEFSHIKLVIDKESHMLMKYETVIDGRASQTLLSDDFDASRSDSEWIKLKLEESNKKYLLKESIAKNTSNPLILKNNDWDFPDFNQTDNIEIVTWNCEFFPTANDSTILSLAEAVLELNTDIIAFQEIRRTGWFSKLMNYLPNYNFIISEQASFMDLAIIFKKDLFKLKKQLELFADDDYNFAGRPPLKADLIYSINKEEIELSIINIHMKCCDSGLLRRKRASKMLHNYIDQYYTTQPNIIILGDWNDDTKDKKGQHCFDPFFHDDRFYFSTYEIALDLKQASYPKEPYVSFLDHILVSNSFIPKESDYHVQTIHMGDYMGGYKIYESYISDHKPVLLSFSVTK